ncbi:MAG: endolytic transglycosylase MltG [Thermotaleaceae bacterium]
MNSFAQRERKKRLRKRIFWILLLLLIFPIFVVYSFNQLVTPIDLNGTSEISIEIPQGASTVKIAKILKEQNLIKNDMAFRMLSKYLKSDGKMQAGKYILSNNMDAKEIINTLVNGAVTNETIKFTIPEGFEFHQIVNRLEHNGLINRERFIQLAEEGDFNYPFLENIPKGKNRLEGFLFPDTYQVSKDATEEDILKKMLDRFNQVFIESYYQKANEMNMSINQVITLASIIEREAKIAHERPLVSSVFHNRIEQKMLLQSCATVQYILGERKENLTLRDIEIDSPYNTYKYLGLPPKPIASPGKASIEAALYPEQTDYLFFVASKNGEHIFSKTYREHLNAKNSN